MICQICHDVYAVQLNFKTLFYIRNLCPKCEEHYQPFNNFEVIPISFGLIEYYYVYDFEENDSRKKRYLYRFMKQYFFDIINQSNLNTITLFIDDYEFNHFPDWFPIIKGFRFLKFYSLFYYDWSQYEDSVSF